MRQITVDNPLAVEETVRVLERGGVVIFPTDTLYGLMGSVEDPRAVQRVFDVKGRERLKSSPVLVGSLEVAQRYALFCETALKLWGAFMPGPLTLVLDAQEGFRVEGVVSYKGKVGVRMPNHKVLLDVLEELGCGVTGTSANPSGFPPARVPEELDLRILEKVDLVVIERKPLMGVPSTVVEVVEKEVVVLREGAVSKEEILNVLRKG